MKYYAVAISKLYPKSERLVGEIESDGDEQAVVLAEKWMSDNDNFVWHIGSPYELVVTKKIAHITEGD